jgi:hypothetical protein
MTLLYWLEKNNNAVDSSFPSGAFRGGNAIARPVDHCPHHDHESIDPEEFEAGARIEPMHKVAIFPSWSILKRKGQ